MEEVGGFGQGLALGRTPADILKKLSDSGEVGGQKRKRRKWRKGEQDWRIGSPVKQPQTSKYPSSPQINALHIPALEDQGRGEVFKDLGLTGEKKEFGTFSQRGNKHLSLITHFKLNCAACVITGNTVARWLGGVCGEGCGEGSGWPSLISLSPVCWGCPPHTKMFLISAGSSITLCPSPTSAASSSSLGAKHSILFPRGVTLLPKEKGTPCEFRHSRQDRRSGESSKACDSSREEG